jgi:hypothetical protein
MLGFMPGPPFHDFSSICGGSGKITRRSGPEKNFLKRGPGPEISLAI